MRDPASVSLHELIEIGFHERASDVFVKAHRVPVMRQHSKMVPVPGDFPVIDPDNSRRMIDAMMSEKQKRILEETLEMDLAFEVAGKCRVRANIHFQKGTYAIVCRIIPLGILSIDELGLPPAIKEL